MLYAIEEHAFDEVRKVYVGNAISIKIVNYGGHVIACRRSNVKRKNTWFLFGYGMLKYSKTYVAVMRWTFSSSYGVVGYEKR